MNLTLKLNNNKMKDPRNILEKALARNEPVFVIRAQDSFSQAILSAYYHLAILLSDDKFIDELEEIREAFIEWQEENRDKLKLPD